MDGSTLTVDDLLVEGVLPVEPTERDPKKVLAAVDAATGRLFSM